MNYFQKLLVSVILFGVSFGINAQHDVSKYQLQNISEPVIPILTNRKVDTIQQNWMVLKNEIEFYNPLKIFIAVILSKQKPSPLK